MTSVSTAEADYCVWAQVPAEAPWHDWQPKLFAHFKWAPDLVVEKWGSQDLQWGKVLDSCNSFTLFRQAKVLVILDAEKALKQAENLDQIIRRFKQGPHRIVFASESALPANLKLPAWKSDAFEEAKVNDRVAFQWIDFIHSNQLTAAMAALDEAVQAGQHPLALVQLITRDFRIGRLIHYATQSRVREAEITSSLRVPGFVIQKWLRREPLGKTRWASLFDRLLQADLELKSGADGIWVLRKLTFDLVELSHSRARSIQFKKFKRPLQPGPLLWTISPSFA